VFGCARRPSVSLATKIFPALPLAPVVEQRAVASASRLGTRLLDLYQVHWPNPVVSDGTIMRGMRALQRVGEVGVRNYPLAGRRGGARRAGAEVRYSLADRAPEKDLLPFAAGAGRRCSPAGGRPRVVVAHPEVAALHRQPVEDVLSRQAVGGQRGCPTLIEATLMAATWFVAESAA
jgi:hypothetical protein